MRSVFVSRVLLAVVGAISFGLVTTVNRLAGELFQLSWLPDSCVVSSVVCVTIYLAIRPAHIFGWPPPATNWRRVSRISLTWLAIWLGLSAVAAMVQGHWVRYWLADTPPQIIGFLLLGPFQEEVLFRGAIFELSERSGFTGRWPPVTISTIFFCLHHFQLHGYAVTAASLLQVGFTIPMGIVFGLLRAETGSLWPSLAVHILTNLPGAIGKRSDG